MAVSRENLAQLDLVLNEVQSRIDAHLSAKSRAEAEHHREVTCLQRYNFFRRNKPYVILTAIEVTSLIFVVAGVLLFRDYVMLPRSGRREHDSNETRKALDAGFGMLSLIVFATGSIIIGILAHLFRKSGTIQNLPSCNPLPVLVIPNFSYKEKEKLSDYFISEHTDKIICLCVRLVDVMDPHISPIIQVAKNVTPLVTKENSDFYPMISTIEDPMNPRVQEIKKTLKVERVKEVINAFKELMEKKIKISDKHQTLTSTALADCMTFCQRYVIEKTSKPDDETRPLLTKPGLA